VISLSLKLFKQQLLWKLHFILKLAQHHSKSNWQLLLFPKDSIQDSTGSLVYTAVGGSCIPILRKIVGVLNPFKRFLVMNGIPITPKYQWRRSHVRWMIDGKGETLIPQTVYHSLLSLLTQTHSDPVSITMDITCQPPFLTSGAFHLV